MANVKGEHVVLADDILTEAAAAAEALQLTEMLCNKLRRLSDRDLRVFGHDYRGEQVIATVTVLDQSAYVIDAATP